MVDEAMQSIYENLKENPLDNQGIENISYNMIEGIEDIFRKYLERVSEAMSLGGFSHMYNSYKQLYYNPEELIEIYEKIKNEKVSRKFRMTKNVKANKIFVNTYPFENYEFEFDEKKLLIKKQIINLSVILRKNIMIKILKKLYIYLEFIVNG